MNKVDLNNKNILVTGTAGFIGSNLAKRLVQEYPTCTVIGLDNKNDYYDIRIKESRLEELNKFDNFIFVKGNLADKELITKIFDEYKPSLVVNLAAQAGVRYSITNPGAYVESNLIGFYNILKACRNYPIEHLVHAHFHQCMGLIKKFHIIQIIKWIIQLVYMQLQKIVMNLWPMHIVSYIIFQVLD